MDALERHRALKEKIRSGQPTLGIFVKTPASSVIELLGNADFDFVALDAEHAPFGVEALDRCLLAARAAGIPALVRVTDAAPATILRALDLGAAGVMVPHIKTAADAAGIVSATRYTTGSRGFSGSHRAGNYGAIPAAELRSRSDASAIVIAQVEDRQAVGNIDGIAAEAGLDAVFIGPADLSVSLGVESWNDPAVEDAINKVCASCRKSSRAVGTFLSDTQGVAANRKRGISFFIISTDQSLLLKGARTVASEFKAACK